MTDKRNSPIEISKEDFKKIGCQLVDSISNFIDTIDQKPVTTGETLQKKQ